jgi:hypothetical protein
MHDLACRIVKRVISHMKNLEIARLLPRHVPLIMFQMCLDPVTRYTRQGLCVQTLKVKSLSKVFARVIQDTTLAFEKDQRYGGIEKKIVKSTTSLIEEAGLKSNSHASVLVAACIAEVCGIMLNDARQLDKKTITLEILQQSSTVHVLSNGETCVNASLVRFIESIKRPIECELEEKREREDAQQRRKKRTSNSTETTRKRIALEEKSVKFSEARRPSTPDHCFWEED